MDLVVLLTRLRIELVRKVGLKFTILERGRLVEGDELAMPMVEVIV